MTGAIRTVSDWQTHLSFKSNQKAVEPISLGMSTEADDRKDKEQVRKRRV